MVVRAGLPPQAAACAACQEQVTWQDNFCETCGTELGPAAVPSGLDHHELNLGRLAGVTDRGLRHHRNEDAMALAAAETAAGPVALAVVCDGVSTSYRPDEASAAAAQAAVHKLLGAVRSGQDYRAASVAAINAAEDAVAVLASPSGGIPSATYISAVMTRSAVTLCWLGDSRGYWLGNKPGPAAQQLTRDDSLAEEMVAAGLLAASDAGGSPHAHVVTRWVGTDDVPPKPNLATFQPPGPGTLLLCSDGLWNYQPDAAKLAELALPTALTDPLGAASKLVNFALEAGGMDNVTAVLMSFPPNGGAGPKIRRR
jgi:serine/threonine protein phosphatase PrpC